MQLPVHFDDWEDLRPVQNKAQSEIQKAEGQTNARAAKGEQQTQRRRKRKKKKKKDWKILTQVPNSPSELYKKTVPL